MARYSIMLLGMNVCCSIGMSESSLRAGPDRWRMMGRIMVLGTILMNVRSKALEWDMRTGVLGR
jgi:hypothetical protein